MRFIGHYREYTHETHKAEAKSMNIHINMLLSHCGHLLMFPQIFKWLFYTLNKTHTLCTVDLINVGLYNLALMLDATRLYETDNSYCIYVQYMLSDEDVTTHKNGILKLQFLAFLIPYRNNKSLQSNW
jgi:hypothetical protein